jgi:undecaprenyl diphosphate synthase
VRFLNELEAFTEEELRARLEGSMPPAHIAVIMDGNGRWAKSHGFARVRGHQAGVRAVRNAVTACREIGVRYLTLYAFSLENWDRPAAEVAALMALLKNYLVGERDELTEKEIRLEAIGRLERLPADVRAELDRSRELTRDFDRLTLTLALSYGGRAELVDAVNRIINEGGRTVDEAGISAHLYAPDRPDPDLLIRTSGEMRLSNFLLWETSYTELYVTEVLWPDFEKKHIYAAVLDYLGRERRFGKVTHSVGGRD